VSLRGRLTLLSALIVGVLLGSAALATYVFTRNELRGQIDEALRGQANLIRDSADRFPPAGIAPDPDRFPRPPQRSGGSAPYLQFVTPDGEIQRPSGDEELPVDDADIAVANGDSGQLLRDRQAGDVHVRVATVPVGEAGAVQLGRSLESTDDVLDRLRLVLALLVAFGVALASALSRLFARRVLAPIGELTEATEHIETTGDLDRRVTADGKDEVSRLAARFNGMLDNLQETQQALTASTEAQRHLVADASHELRTPIASLRTNIEVLLASGDIAPHERRALLADVVEQTDELSAVVADLIELARGDQPRAEPQDLDLAEIVEEALTRARLHAPAITFEADVQPWPMTGEPERLGRALNNVLDNAAKFSPPDSTVTVTLWEGELLITDQGPGVPADELPHIFDRFYRGRASTAYQGSGLGLAIVKHVVEASGGSVAAESPAARGGLTIRMRFAHDAPTD
jgi:two-component system sensor histidine kinase MprB